jgi:hypothetical protein
MLRAGNLNVSFSTIATGTVVNLSQEGALDWVHWGLFTETSIDRKASVTPQISDFALIDASNGYAYVYQYGDNWNGYSWNDGTPHTSVTNTTTGVWVYGTPPIGSGFRFSVPADTNSRTLRVYVGAFAAKGRFTATLSDNSAPGYTNGFNQMVLNMAGGPSACYTLNFSANSSNQALFITYTVQQTFGANGNVTLQSASLTAPGANNVPFVALTSPIEGTSVLAPTNVLLNATASDNDGSVTLIEFYDGATKLGDVVPPQSSFTWSNVPAGRHVITARAIDNLAAVGVSSPVTLFVAGSGGSLTGARVTSPTALNLTTEGTSDWTHWGLSNPSNFNHKASGGGQILNFTRLGTNAVKRYTDNRTAFSWADGTPVASVAGTNVGVFIMGVTNGFEFSAPADTNARTLRIYAGLYGAQGNFQAWLSDFSGRAFTDMTLSNVFGNSYVVYTLNYAATTNSQRLFVRYTLQNAFDFDFGNVTLQAATLQGPPFRPPALLTDPHWSDGVFQFSFQTASNCSYAAQSTPWFPAGSWQTFSNISGTGGRVTVFAPAGGSPAQFYRVLTQ